MIKDYLEEKDGARVILTEGGFLSYFVTGKQFYIAEFFIASSHRQSSKHFLHIMRLAYDEAVKNFCEDFTCHVPMSLRDVSGVVLSRLKFGFKITGIEDNKLCFRLPLSECSKWVAQ